MTPSRPDTRGCLPPPPTAPPIRVYTPLVANLKGEEPVAAEQQRTKAWGGNKEINVGLEYTEQELEYLRAVEKFWQERQLKHLTALSYLHVARQVIEAEQAGRPVQTGERKAG